jgi:hypothetical protein
MLMANTSIRELKINGNKFSEQSLEGLYYSVFESGDLLKLDMGSMQIACGNMYR